MLVVDLRGEESVARVWIIQRSQYILGEGCAIVHHKILVVALKAAVQGHLPVFERPARLHDDRVGVCEDAQQTR